MIINAYSEQGLRIIDEIRKLNNLPTLEEERREDQIKGVMKDFNFTREEAMDFLGIS